MIHKNKLIILSFALLLAFSSTSYADLSALKKGLDSLKNDIVKKKSATVSTPEPQKENTEIQEAQPAPITEKKYNYRENQYAEEPDNSADVFRNAWCKNVDEESTGRINYRGVAVGDLCLAPDGLIVALKNRLEKLKVPMYWWNDATMFDEDLGPTFTIKNLVYEDKQFTALSLSVDRYNQRAYIGSFEGVICGADLSNSLDSGNSFRTALETKYGKPSLALTEYDALVRQIKQLEAMNNQARKKQLTISEAKKVRETDSNIESLKRIVNKVDRKSVKNLIWNYEEPNTISPIGSMVIGKTDAYLGDVGGCPNLNQTNNNVAFLATFFGSKHFYELAQKIDALDAKNKKEKEKKAATPDL